MPGGPRNGDPDPPKIEAAPADRVAWEQGRGRPSDIRNLRDAQRVLVSVLARVGHGKTDPVEIPVRMVAQDTGLTSRRVRDVTDLVSLLGDSTVVRSGEELEVYPAPRLGPALIDASQALAARLDASAVASLQGAQVELDSELTDDALLAWKAKLDAFLSQAPWPDVSLPCPTARKVIAAIDDHDTLDATIGDGTHRREVRLAPTELHWQHNRWWVGGTLDDEGLRPEQLPLSSVVAVSMEQL
jgi:hypothetical protein